MFRERRKVSGLASAAKSMLDVTRTEMRRGAFAYSSDHRLRWPRNLGATTSNHITLRELTDFFPNNNIISCQLLFDIKAVFSYLKQSLGSLGIFQLP